MSTTPIVNEGTTSYVTAAFTDKDGAAAVPTSVTYSIYCETTSTEIKAATSVSAASTIEVTITSDENLLQSEASQYETRTVTFIAVYGVGDQATEEFVYNVKNLNQI